MKSRPLVAAGVAGIAFAVFCNKMRPRMKLNRLISGNLRLFSSSERRAIQHLANDPAKKHILRYWPKPGIRDSAKRHLIALARSGAEDVEPARQALIDLPMANKAPQLIQAHGDVRQDDYYWLRDDARKNKDVVAHLNAENDHVKFVLADTEELQGLLYKEMRARIQEDDTSASQRVQGHWYYNRTLQGQQYAVHCRKKLAALDEPYLETSTPDETQPEEILLDENLEAQKYTFYMVGGFSVSPNEQFLAWGEDTKGNESYTLRVKDLTTGKELLTKPIPETAGNFVWANDNKTLFYVTKDELDRPYKVWRHEIGTDSSQEDSLIFHESDESFYVSIIRTRSEELLVINSGSAITSESRILSADDPRGDWRIVLERQHDVEYSVDHRGDQLILIMRDASRPNQEVLVLPLRDLHSLPTVIMPHRDDVQIESIEVSKDHLVSFERCEGLQQAVIYHLQGSIKPLDSREGQHIQFDEPAYELNSSDSGDFESPILRFHYTSLTTPDTTVDFNMETGTRCVKKVQAVLGGFDSSAYKTERLWAINGEDQVKVPISLVFRKDLVTLDGTDPLLLDAYGSYQICNDPDFRSTRLSLIDRGFIFAIAHVRGGGELGRQWYENGKYGKKKNTFSDLIACAEHLIAQNYTSPKKLCIQGRSAGGLTMGATVNMRPDLFLAVINGVGFVDCLTTMLDESIPLTVIEYDEWGNPSADVETYNYIKSYSPVDNVRAAEYPHILATAGLHDPRVGYWEPAKYISKIRETRTNKNMLLFKCEMGSGHFSKSGRFDRLEEIAVEFAFLLKCQGMLDVELKPSGK